jgi:hypothetical protein
MTKMHYDPYQHAHEWELHYAGSISDATPEKPGRWCLCFIAWLLIELGWAILKRCSELQEVKADHLQSSDSHKVSSTGEMRSSRPSPVEFSLN